MATNASFSDSDDNEIAILCDNNGAFVRRYLFDGNGNVSGTVNLTLAGAAYVPVGPVVVCSTSASEVDVEELVLCDNNGVAFIRRYVFNSSTGAVISTTDLTLAGAAFVPVLPVHDCGRDTFEEVLCDNNGGFIRRFLVDANTGAILSTTDLSLAGGAYVTVGTVGVCGGSRAFTEEILCDTNGPFIRRFQFNTTTGSLTSTTDLTLAGGAYVTVGTVRVCDIDIEEEVLCDNNGVAFVRRYQFNGSTGALLSTTDLTFAGAPYVPVLPVHDCGAVRDAEIEVLCDSNNTTFLRRYLYNAETGAIVTITDTDLAGAPFAPVGAVGECQNCCPIALGTGCATGNRRWTAIRAANGTVTLVNQTDGTTVLPADVVACSDTLGAVLDSTVQRQTGAGSVGIAVNARSVTLVVLTTATAGVTVNLGQGNMTIPPGVSLSWAVDANNQSLSDVFSFTGVAGSDFIVTSTR